MANLSKDEEKLLAAFGQLSDEQQEVVLEVIQVYASNERRASNAPPEQQHLPQ